jgi:hypothetical protein
MTNTTAEQVLATEFSRDFIAELFKLVPEPFYDAHEAAIDGFVEKMKARMLVSYYKYGPLEKAYPHKIDALDCLVLRLTKYEDERNSEHLVDAANYAMIEFMRPRTLFNSYASPRSYVGTRLGGMFTEAVRYRHSGDPDVLVSLTHLLLVEYLTPELAGVTFTATDSSGSPGRVTTTGEINQAANEALG